MTSDDIKQYTEKSFTFDCPRMVLRQNIDSSARVYEGPGTIYQNEEGELLFKLYSTGPPDTTILTRIFGPGARISITRKLLQARMMMPRGSSLPTSAPLPTRLADTSSTE